jgi:hypothetical protein
MDDIETDYVIDAVSFIGRYGERFLHLYKFDLQTGCWQHRGDRTVLPELSLAAAVHATQIEKTALPVEQRARLYRSYLDEAQAAAQRLCDEQACDWQLPNELADLQYFALDKRAVS